MKSYMLYAKEISMICTMCDSGFILANWLFKEFSPGFDFANLAKTHKNLSHE